MMGAEQTTGVGEQMGEQQEATRAATPEDLRSWRSWLPGAQDAACILLLLAATLYLVGHDGGRPYRPMLPVLLLAISAVIAALPTLRRLPTWLIALLIAWTAGPIISLIFADVRAGWVRPVAAMALFVPVVLASLHLLRRRWGQTAILALVGLALGHAWYASLLGWWGGSTSRGEPAWMALSWHNQSGTLMAVLGVGALGVALVRTRWSRIVAVTAASAGLSAAWMSGSRAVVACATLALVIVVATRLRRGIDRSVPLTTLVTAALTITMIIGLGALYGDATSTPDSRSTGLTEQPVTARQQDAIGNLQARFGHWEAALRMFASAPLTGTGPGSYEWSSVPVYPDDINRTSSAHGEQVEALGELGLLGGGAAVVLVSAVLALAVIAGLRRPGRHDLEVAAAGVTTLLVSHAALDFDWDYPMLLGLLAIATGVLAASRLLDDPLTEPAPPDNARAARVIALATTCLLPLVATAGIAGHLTGSTPWQVRGAMAGSLALATDDPGASDANLELLRRWNPGEPRLPDIQRLVAHQRGELADDQLAASIDPERTRFGDQLMAAEQLIAADRPDLAQAIIADMRPVLHQRRAWGVAVSVARATSLSLTIAWEDGGCSNVEEAWADLGPWAASYATQPAPIEGMSDEWTECELTTLPDG